MKHAKKPKPPQLFEGFVTGLMSGIILGLVAVLICIPAQPSPGSPRYRAGACVAKIERERWANDTVWYVTRVGKLNYGIKLCSSFRTEYQRSFEWLENVSEAIPCPKDCKKEWK